MTIQDLYKNFDIPMAQFAKNETANEYGRRVMSTNFVNSEHSGVIYSTGSTVESVNVHQTAQTEYQLYSY
ncbi:hypothetical protein AAAW43_001087 [Cronobacter sakazakii]|uniref:Uncharacterized protein n=1 Tax=Cronobacter sakazakii TaxID=28141 RepID=A0AAN5X6L9_CROSK|nr:hypothetical protein [Cronobacter sakazakii]EJG0810286.1 hypothetical protein [Cronobacter sakazakii]ELY2708360.1 hypothetical protein [Cronobacter sakazakii]ELY4780747.1 hypothetical protein [Cronobacter sakazakii]ELZ1660095.1 hypothetical protein [Cronobacter sakazakii]EMC4306958.1 hypothetical protein [Cronobacter sakazakii]